MEVYCSTHGMVVPDAETVDDDRGLVTEFHCPQCGEVGATVIDGGRLNIAQLMMIDDEPKPGDHLKMFYEGFTGVVDTGIYSVRAVIVPGGYEIRPTRRDLLRRFWRQKLSIRPRWKRCVPITCPPVETVEVNFTSHHWEPTAPIPPVFDKIEPQTPSPGRAAPPQDH